MDTATLLSAPASTTADDRRRLGQPVHALFSEVARRMPEQTALVSRSGSVTYRELDAQSEAVAGALHRRGVKPGDRIGLYARRSSQTVAAIIGILKTGAAYV